MSNTMTNLAVEIYRTFV